MTNSPIAGKEIIFCPHCKAANQPGIIVCTSCGIRLDTYDDISQQWHNRQNEQNLARLESLSQNASDREQKELKKSRRKLTIQLLTVLAVTLFLIPVAWGGGALVTYWRQLAYHKMESRYEMGVTCEQQKDFLCARDSFLAVYQEDAHFKDSRARLMAARKNLADQYQANGQTQYAIQELDAILQITPDDPVLLMTIFTTRRTLAEQYVVSSRWQDAIDELDKALAIRPGDADTLARMNKIYDQWYQVAKKSGNWLTAWSIKRKWDARFPK
jgi:tetratricopeptide (TPR) repeat protein